MTEGLPTPSPPAIVVSGLGKRFPGVVALDGVDLEFRAGAVTSVVGENGAGKSTLMTILAGLQRPDTGTVTVAGDDVDTFSPHEMLHRHGVALVPQEIELCPERTVAENVLLGREPGLVPSRRRMIATTRSLLRQIETDIDPDTRAGRLSLAEQQLLLIVRALARDCRVLILDEPTTSLTSHEADRLFGLLRRLRAAGTTIIYVSHRLPEVLGLSDVIHVLRDGAHVRSFESGDVDGAQIVRAMVGRQLAERLDTSGRTRGTTMLEVTGLSSHPLVDDVSFHVDAGEIVGIAGLPDSGRSELVAALFGARKCDGIIAIDGRTASIRSPRHAIRAGIGYVPAERRSQGLFPDMSVGDNATVLELGAHSRLGVVRRRRLRRLAAQRLATDDVRGQSGVKIGGLSGGNQQKVILGRWLARRPRVLLLDDPTRGVDIGAKTEIHDRLADAARQGTAVVMASSDLPELLRTCDRIIVMARGRVAGVVDAAEATEETVMSLATTVVPIS